jgi:hypothetical protein
VGEPLQDQPGQPAPTTRSDARTVARDARTPAPPLAPPERTEPTGRLRTYIVAEACAVALGYVAATLRDGPPRTLPQWSLVVAGGVAVAVPLFIKSRRELRTQAQARSVETLAIEADAKLRLVVGDVVTPVAELVGRVHQARAGPERAALRGQLKQLVVETVADLTDGDRTRATFFELAGGVMRPQASTGRGDLPETVFTNDPGDRRGQEALLLVQHHDYLSVEDIHADRLPAGVQPRPDSSYSAFISVAVFCGEQTFGMLSVDAPEPGAFDETDLNVMRAMAQLLGAGLVDER